MLDSKKPNDAMKYELLKAKDKEWVVFLHKRLNLLYLSTFDFWAAHHITRNANQFLRLKSFANYLYSLPGVALAIGDWGDWGLGTLGTREFGDRGT